MKKIIFDMDGTLANFYGQKDWMEKLQKEDVTVYSEAEPLEDADKINNLLFKLKDKGYSFSVISWLSKSGSPEFNMKTSLAKINWIKKYFPIITDVRCVLYGTPKHQVSKNLYDIIIDDDENVLKAWKENKRGKALDAKLGVCMQLEGLL